MPQYFFDVNGDGVPDSDKGQTLANDDAAWHEATLVAGEIFKDVDGKLKPGEGWKLEVQDEKRRRLFSINVTSKQLK
jgi:hypothetical protein